MKRAVKADRARCRECPLFEPSYDSDFNDVNVSVFDERGERVVRNGIPLLFKHKDGGLVRWGMCGADLPERRTIKDTTGQERVGSSMLEVRSDWFCESAEKYAALSRLK